VFNISILLIKTPLCITKDDRLTMASEVNCTLLEESYGNTGSNTPRFYTTSMWNPHR